MRRGSIAAACLGAAAFSLAGAGAGGLAFVRLLLLGAALGSAVAFDLGERRIPNRLVLPASVGCAALALADGAPPRASLTGVVLVALLFALSFLRPAALGMGDVKLALLVVFGLGAASFEALVLALALAALWGCLLSLRHGRAAGTLVLPLAPFLAAGAALTVLS